MSDLIVSEYAVMAADAYLDESKALPELGVRGWRRMKDAPKLDFHDSFFARVYENPFTHAYVIAIRGTELSSIGDIRADLQYAFGNEPTIYKKAKHFYETVYHYLVKHNNITPEQLTVTGHSLGGILAKLLAVNYGLEAVVFNAPGVAKFLTPEQRKHTNHILNVNSEEGSINKFGKQAGRSVSVKLLEGEMACDLAHATKIPLLEADCIYEKHKMANLITAINFNPRVSGMHV